MKSFASSEMTSKLSSSKSHSAAVTFAKVSLLSSPIKGERPLRLQAVEKRHEQHTDGTKNEKIYLSNPRPTNFLYTRIYEPSNVK